MTGQGQEGQQGWVAAAALLPRQARHWCLGVRRRWLELLWHHPQVAQRAAQQWPVPRPLGGAQCWLGPPGLARRGLAGLGGTRMLA